MIYNLFVDEKVKVWKRRYMTVEASDLDEAIKNYKEGNFDEGDTEELYETEELMSPEENNGFPTIEVYNKDSYDTIWTNVEK